MTPQSGLRALALWPVSRAGLLVLSVLLAAAVATAAVAIVANNDTVLALAVLGAVVVLFVLVVGIAAAATAIRTQLAALAATSTGGWTEQSTARVLERLGSSPAGIEERVRRATARDVSALLGLYRLVDVTAEVPPPAGWAATPQTLLAMVDMVRSLPDGAVIVECGSGTSSVWLGLAAKQQNRGITVIALEHDPAFAEQTRHALAANDLSTTVEVRVAPLSPTLIDEQSYPWFTLDALDGIEGVALLFVDGPPARSGVQARLPAFPLLREALVDGAIVILDDTNRADEQQILARWLAMEGRGRLRQGRELDRSSVLHFDLE